MIDFLFKVYVSRQNCLLILLIDKNINKILTKRLSKLFEKCIILSKFMINMQKMGGFQSFNVKNLPIVDIWMYIQYHDTSITLLGGNKNVQDIKSRKAG